MILKDFNFIDFPVCFIGGRSRAKSRAPVIKNVSHINMKPKIGDIFEIQLEEGAVCYAQALNEPEFAFYKSSPLSNEKLKPIFRLWVHKSAIKEWNKIGNQFLSAELKFEIPRFQQDSINGSLSIYQGENEEPATHEQIQGLECAAVWEGNHIKDRLTDYLAGRKNIWVESMRPKLNG